MAGAILPKGAPKRKRTKKRKSRTEVSSDSESESDIQQRKSKASKLEENLKVETKDATATKSTKPSETDAKPTKEKKKKAKSKSTATSQPSSTKNADIDTLMTDAVQPVSFQTTNGSAAPIKAPEPSKADSLQPAEDFTSYYLRKVTTELADDLDKVREASDFSSRSLPLLIHLLKQGESTFSVEERRRLVASR
ncbi:hypothetical protein K491DRAFT_676947 [Lophiostoma macrostomum CBS 122681]|uniref:Ribosome assembly protein 3 n=1 Tax=Lophiostoma macrostomum CBS 122681 TaxID=1314788 RepID=A0A6A6TF00_9PLEO|nr:hypothetical protein K491DRAFT_676947 [Lophiostoma macrostomum CBS 122681]